MEDHISRYPIDLQLLGEFLILIYIYFDHTYRLTQGIRHLLDRSVHIIGQIMPARIKNDKNRLASTYYISKCLHIYYGFILQKISLACYCAANIRFFPELS